MHAVGSDVRIKLSINAPFGLKTEYDDDWMGRFVAIESELKTLNAQPTLAYRLSPQVSIGAGINVQYAEATLRQGVNVGGAGEGRVELKGDDWAVGYGWIDISTDGKHASGSCLQVTHSPYFAG